MKKLVYPLLLTTAIATTSLAETCRVFIGTSEKGIYTTTLDQKTGALTPPQLAAEVQHSGFLAKHPQKPILYSTATLEKGVGGIASFKITKEGMLEKINEQKIQGRRLCHISLDATSKMLMGANYPEGNVVSLPINQDGSISPLVSQHQHEGSSTHPQRQTKPHAHSIYAGPNNQFAYAPDLGIDKVMIYRITPKTAKLTPAGFAQTPAGAGPRHMKFSRDGKHAYVLNELDLTISVFSLNPNSGKLTSSSVVSTLPKEAERKDMTCSEIRVSSNGKFVYCANRDLTEQGRDSLSVFQVGDSGQLTRIQTIGAEVWIPRNINLDPSGKWLLVAGQRSNDVPVFSIDTTTGKLRFTGNEINVPKAMCIEFAKN